jgi:curli production assembly/transport component CsgE
LTFLKQSRLQRSSRVPLLFAALCGCAHGQLSRENEQPIERRGLADLVGGLVLDATVTVLGHEFFSAYADAWRELDSQQRYSVTIHEAPTARFGSTIRIQARGRTIYQSLLRPNRQAARELAQTVAADLFSGLIQAEAEEALFRDPDLGPEELR